MLLLGVNTQEVAICLQEVMTQAEQAAAALKAERRRYQALEKQLKATSEAKLEAVAGAAAAAEERQASSTELDRVKRVAEERAGLVVQAENAAVEARQQCDAQVRHLSCAHSRQGCLYGRSHRVLHLRSESAGRVLCILYLIFWCSIKIYY